MLFEIKKGDSSSLGILGFLTRQDHIPQTNLFFYVKLSKHIEMKLNHFVGLKSDKMRVDFSVHLVVWEFTDQYSGFPRQGVLTL